MIGVPFYHRVVPPNRLHARIGRVFFSKFLYVRILPEYPYNIAHAWANVVWVLRSRKTYSRYMKKNSPVRKLSTISCNPVGTFKSKIYYAVVPVINLKSYSLSKLAKTGLKLEIIGIFSGRTAGTLGFSTVFSTTVDAELLAKFSTKFRHFRY